MKKIYWLVLFFLGVGVLACMKRCHNTKETQWYPNPKTIISPAQNTKTWSGEEIENTALAGKWRVSLCDNNPAHSQLGIYLTVCDDGDFSLTINNDVDDEAENYFKTTFSEQCARGKTLSGFVKCYDEWCAEGNGPDGSYVVGFFDNDSTLFNYYAFVYCQINNNQFTLDKLQEDGIGFELIPIPERTLKEL